jgi:hypothetical protein
MIALLALLSMPAPPSPPRTIPTAPISWQCDIANPQWRRFRLAGNFPSFPPETIGSSGRVESAIVSDSSNRFVGSHAGYLQSRNGGTEGWYTIIVRRPNQAFYHFQLRFFGAAQLGVVEIEEQLLGVTPNIFRPAGVGYCTVREDPSSPRKPA